MTQDDYIYQKFVRLDDGEMWELSKEEVKDAIYHLWEMYDVTLLEADYLPAVYGKWLYPKSVVFSYRGKCYGTDFKNLWREYGYESDGA